jgi:hypothetical protein
MTVHEVLRAAIDSKCCVRLRVAGAERRVCPHALGFKKGSPRLLAFQYEGSSASGLMPGGQWRAFYIREIEDASIVEGAWRSGRNFIAKAEACLDRVAFSVHH